MKVLLLLLQVRVQVQDGVVHLQLLSILLTLVGVKLILLLDLNLMNLLLGLVVQLLVFQLVVLFKELNLLKQKHMMAKSSK